MNLNKIQLIGNLAADPVGKQLPSGRTVATFRLVTKTITKNERATMVLDHSEHHHVVSYGRLPDVVAKCIKKGDRVYLDGSLTYRTGKGQGDAVRSRTEIVMQNLIMLGGAKKQSKREPTNDDVVAEDVDTEEKRES